MIELPIGLRCALEEALGATVTTASHISGGMINQAARVETSSGTLFVKWRGQAPVGFFGAEAEALERLRMVGALRVPRVLALGWETDDGTPAFLALEYIAACPSSDPSLLARRFGEGLAALHKQTVSPPAAFGLDLDGFIGSLPQPNAWHDTWPAFYRDCRLMPQIEIARNGGRLTATSERLLETILSRLDTLFEGFSSPPALIHGDLWSGNVIAVGDEPVLVDPAAYYADREIEIAYIELFGGMPDGLLAAYESIYPLDSGYQRRREVHQLYPLLVHMNHFGEMYGPRVEACCQAALRHG